MISLFDAYVLFFKRYFYDIHESSRFFFSSNIGNLI